MPDLRLTVGTSLNHGIWLVLRTSLEEDFERVILRAFHLSLLRLEYLLVGFGCFEGLLVSIHEVYQERLRTSLPSPVLVQTAGREMIPDVMT